MGGLRKGRPMGGHDAACDKPDPVLVTGVWSKPRTKQPDPPNLYISIQRILGVNMYVDNHARSSFDFFCDIAILGLIRPKPRPCSYPLIM